jgi:hypothetical protein
MTPDPASHEEIRTELARLFQTYDKPLSDRLIRTWIPLAEAGGWTRKQIASAVTRYVDEMVWSPKGWADFKRFLPAPVSGSDSEPQPAWWGLDGQWGGDWSKVTAGYILSVIREIESNAIGSLNRDSRRSLMNLALGKGATREQLDEICKPKQGQFGMIEEARKKG